MFKDMDTRAISYCDFTSEQHTMAPNRISEIKQIMEDEITIGFNSLNYDFPLIWAMIEGWSTDALYNLSTTIIKTNISTYTICRNNHLDIPFHKWSHIDLINVAPGKASLKVYGGRMHAPKLQSLPIPPNTLIALDMQETLRLYCTNDLDTTELLYTTLKPQIDLRISMSKQYNIDLRSKSDAQIAEHVIAHVLKIKKVNEINVTKIHYQNPKIISFQSPELNNVFEKILEHDFEFMGNGAIKLPEWMKDHPIIINKTQYNMGIGGLHSCEKGQYIEGNGDILADWDVASYYPSIILQQQLAPKAMGQKFLCLYQSLVARRLAAKAAHDTVTANTLKIVLNGSFGKLGSKFSILYAPELLLQTTITGQLALFMLIERMESAGIEIVSANTDGIICHCPKILEDTMERIAWEWMLDTSFELERTDYKLIASRDVNNYCAVKLDGNIKRKGCFANGGLMKNPDRNIIYTAIIEFLKDRTPIEETITGCKDIRQFITVRHVTGGARWNGELLGKAIRYYASTESILIDPAITYALNGNKVPKSTGCRPLMDLCDGVPADLDYGRYIMDAEKLLKEVGYVGA
jgi:DNA polymerase elongation subunit (family B)